jgi:hypothetical protein
MDHQEYDKGSWVDDCGCHEPPPKKPAIATNSATEGKAGATWAEKGAMNDGRED